MSYLLIVEGQEIPLTAEVAVTDETVRNCIAPFYPSAATAILRREEVDGITRIHMVKTAGTKGSSVLQSLLDSDDSLNRALALSFQLKQLEIEGSMDIAILLEFQQEIDNAIALGSDWSDHSKASLNKLIGTLPCASTVAIVGF